MARDLGVPFTTEKPYYFISYNSGDENRVSKYVKTLSDSNLSMWYDNGIRKGKNWENEIADMMQKCEAVIMFLSKKIFLKEDSYVHTEYELATKHFKKDVLVVMMDEVKNDEVPNRFKMWWIQVNKLQCIEAFNHCCIEDCVQEILAIPEIKHKNKLKTGKREKFDFTPKGKMVCSVTESKKIHETKNLFIEGQNENSIKHLLRQYCSKADIVYIDPPFNSGMNTFVYEQASNGEWEYMIEQRLIMARELLADSGVVFICIDDNEEHTLKKVCHEVFGKENFIGNIILANYKRSHTNKFVSSTHEYILVYAKGKRLEFKKMFSSVWDREDIGDSRVAYAETKKLLNVSNRLTCDKTVDLIKKLIHVADDKNSLIIDLYSRAGATAHSVMELNAEDGGERNYILVQGAENEEGDNAQASLIKKRIALAGEKISSAMESNVDFDDGFIVYKTDMNM